MDEFYVIKTRFLESLNTPLKIFAVSFSQKKKSF